MKRFNTYRVRVGFGRFQLLEYAFQCDFCGRIEHILVDKFWGWKTRFLT